ncbi:phosphate ABC transporter permease family protein, partial [Halomonas marinisediminis]
RISDGLDAAVARGSMTEAEARSLRADATDIRQVLGTVGVALGSDVDPATLRAAQAYRTASASLSTWMTVVVLAIALVGLGLSWLRTNRDFRARNTVETAILGLL